MWPLVCCAQIQAASARENWIFDIRSGVLYDSNVSNSDRSADVEHDFAWHGVVDAGQGFQLNDNLRLSVFGEMDGEVWATYDGLSNFRPGLSTNLRYRFGLGRNAPWIRLETKVAYADFAEARRSGWDVLPAVRGGISLNERFKLEAGYQYECFAARDAVFEQNAHRVSLHGKLDITSSLQVAIGYTYRYGDVTSTAIPPRPDIVRIAEAREFIDTFDELYVAYRFPASTHIASVGISQTLTNSVALQASYEFQYTTHDPLHYTNHVAELSLALSF
ncbi:MAG: hypothetical protein ACXWBM_09005 [Chthoniobacterales bacterium]